MALTRRMALIQALDWRRHLRSAPVGNSHWEGEERAYIQRRMLMWLDLARRLRQITRAGL